MTSAFKARILTLILVGVLPAASLVQAQQGEYTDTRMGARDMQLHLEVQQATYKLGEPTRVRLTLRNTFNHPILIMDGSPSIIVPLHIFDAHGHEIKPAAVGFMSTGRGLVPIAPNTEVTLKIHGQEWLDLRDFGYDLRTPGSYTIVRDPKQLTSEFTPNAGRGADRATITISR